MATKQLVNMSPIWSIPFNRVYDFSLSFTAFKHVSWYGFNTTGSLHCKIARIGICQQNHSRMYGKRHLLNEKVLLNIHI